MEFTGFKNGSEVTVYGSSDASCQNGTIAGASRNGQAVTITETCMGSDLKVIYWLNERKK